MRSIRKSNKTFKKRGKFGGKKNGKRKTMKTKRGKGAKKLKKKSRKMKGGGDGSEGSTYYVVDNGVTGDIFGRLKAGIKEPRKVEEMKFKKFDENKGGNYITLYTKPGWRMGGGEDNSGIELTKNEYDMYIKHYPGEDLHYNPETNQLGLLLDDEQKLDLAIYNKMTGSN